MTYGNFTGQKTMTKATNSSGMQIKESGTRRPLGILSENYPSDEDLERTTTFKKEERNERR